MSKPTMIFGILILVCLIAACSTSTEIIPIKINNLGWHLRALPSVPTATVYQILTIGDRRMPTYKNCTNANDRRQVAFECALDLLFLPSPDYSTDSANQFMEHIQAVIQNVFGVKNALNRQNMYSDALRPFQFYITGYQYGDQLPQKGACNPGLPLEWVPTESNLGDVDLPAFDCNIALSTAGVELNLGFILHQQSEPDRNRYNLFSSEFNSYGAILHELSHAAFVMSDEAPSADNSGRFQPKHYPNVYTAAIEADCARICADSCIEIRKLNKTGGADEGSSGFFRCQPPETIDQTNLMYFYPQPTPGDNTRWSFYDYQYASLDRLQYIYEKCNDAKC